MPQIKIPIQAERIEYKCDCCKGVYRLTQKTPNRNDCNHTWEQSCTGCGKVVDFTTPYPLIEHGGKTFMLIDSKPPPDSPS